MVDVRRKISEIKERSGVERENAYHFGTERKRKLLAEDLPDLLLLVEELRDQLCKYTCECGPASNPDPKEHADYCLYRSALRDAARGVYEDG